MVQRKQLPHRFGEGLLVFQTIIFLRFPFQFSLFSFTFTFIPITSTRPVILNVSCLGSHVKNSFKRSFARFFSLFFFTRPYPLSDGLFLFPFLSVPLSYVLYLVTEFSFRLNTMHYF